MTQDELVDYIKRSLGYPMIKLEITNDHIIDSINRSLEMYKKWAMSNATQETYFTFQTIPGTSLYQMPVGVLDIISYTSKNYASGINTLFTIENYFFNKGTYDGLRNSGSEYSIVDLHIAKDYLDLLSRYTSDKYHWKYHKIRNQLELKPIPTEASYILVKALTLEGCFLGVTEDEYNEYFYNSAWVQDYAIAKTKVTLGTIKRKFQNFNSIGNTGIALDGAEMIQEGLDAIEKLEEKLKTEETYEGWAFTVG